MCMVYTRRSCHTEANYMLVATYVTKANSFHQHIQTREPNARGPIWVASLVRAITVSVFVKIEAEIILYILIVYSLVATYLVPLGRR